MVCTSYIRVSKPSSCCGIHREHFSVDLKPDNVLFCDGTAPASLREVLDSSPLAVDGEFELQGGRFPIIRSQPVPHPFKWKSTSGMLYTLRLSYN